MKNAEVYFATAENVRLARYYAEQIQFEVITGIGEEGLDYAIKTPKYKGKRKENRGYA